MTSKKSDRKITRKVLIETNRRKGEGNWGLARPANSKKEAVERRKGWAKDATKTIKKVKVDLKKAGRHIHAGEVVIGRPNYVGAKVHKAPHPKKKLPGKPNQKGVKGAKPLPKYTREKGVLVGRNPTAMRQHLAKKYTKSTSASKHKK